MPEAMAYLGPHGTFCEEAASKYTHHGDYELHPYPSIAAIFDAVHQGKIARGIVPIENSCEGSVNQTLDLLSHNYDIKIAGEIILAVEHHLLAREETKLHKISHILSHPQALAQCRDYLSKNYPAVELVDTASTAGAAQQVAISNNSWAAIGTKTAAQYYELNIIGSQISNQSYNETRFIVIAGEDSPYCSTCKTSLLIYLRHQSGALYKVLREFYLRDINLNKIESRPTSKKIGDYLFFIDIEGHRQESRISETLLALENVSQAVYVLGSYPVCVY